MGDVRWAALTPEALEETLQRLLEVAEDRGEDGRVLTPAAPVSLGQILADSLDVSRATAASTTSGSGTERSKPPPRDGVLPILATVAQLNQMLIGLVPVEDHPDYGAISHFRLGDRGYFYAIARPDAPEAIEHVLLSAWEPHDARVAFTRASALAFPPDHASLKEAHWRHVIERLEFVPEVRDEPGWAEAASSQGIARIEDADPMLIHYLMAAVIRRGLDTDDRELVTRALSSLEADLAAELESIRGSAEWTLRGVIEEGLGDGGGLLGPMSRRLLDDYTESSRFWAPVIERLDGIYARIQASVAHRYPWADAESGLTVDLHGFSHQIWFEHSSLGWAMDRDLLVSFSCWNWDEGDIGYPDFSIELARTPLISVAASEPLVDFSDESVAAAMRFVDQVEMLADEHMEEALAALGRVPTVAQMRGLRHVVASTPPGLDPGCSDEEWSRAFTQDLRESHAPAWVLLRDRVVAAGLDPRRCVVADVVPDLEGDVLQDHGLIVGSDSRVFAYTLDVFHRRNDLVHYEVVRWQHVQDDGTLFAFADAIGRARSILGAP